MVLVVTWDRWKVGAGLSDQGTGRTIFGGGRDLLGETAVRPPVFVSSQKHKKPERIIMPEMIRPWKVSQF